MKESRKIDSFFHCGLARGSRLQAVGEEETRLVVYGLHRGFDASATTQKPLSDPTAPRPRH
jgi:hypothetical protein